MLGSLGQWQERRMLTASYGTMMTTVIILLALVASPVAMGLQYEDPENVFMANLNGSNNVPPIDTNATAVFSMSPADDGTVAFALAIWNIQNFTMAHIHAGNATTNGPIVVPLVPLPQERQTTVDGLQEVSPPQSGDLYFLGTFSSADFIASLANGTVSEFISMAKNPSNFYVNVHTVQHPPGEIRGQLGPMNNTLGS